DLRDPADFNKNNIVNGTDFSILAHHWLANVPSHSDGDATGDEHVDRSDILAFESSRITTFMGTPLVRIDGDCDRDGVVSVGDIRLWAANYPRDEPGEPYTDGDANGDGRVNLQDLEIIRANHGKIIADIDGNFTVDIGDIDVI